MGWHEQSLSVFEAWQRYQDNLPDGSFFKLPDPQRPAYYFQAFFDGDLARTEYAYDCLLYTSPSPRDGLLSRMPSSA